MRNGKDGSAGLPEHMRFQRAFLLFPAVCACAAALHAGQWSGRIIDPAGQPVPGAQVAVVNAAGVITQQITDDAGRFNIYISPLHENIRARVSAPGFQTTTAPAGASRIVLAIAPRNESIRVVGTSLDIPAGEQGSSVSVVTSRELRERNEAQV